MSKCGTNKCLSFFVVIFLAFLVFSHKGYAVPAAPLIHKLTRFDGTTFHAKQWGDESCHGWETEDGYTIIFDKGLNSWTYAKHDRHGKLISSSRVVGRDSPPTICVPHMRPTGRARSKIIRRMTTKEILAKTFQRESLSAEKAVSQKVVPPTGTANIPAILINFSNTTSTFTKENFNTLLFGTGNYSMKDFYEEVSYGQFSVSPGPSGVVGWYTASKTHDYYGQNDADGDDMWPGDLVYEAVMAADAVVDFSAYDADGDGYVDAVNIVHQGTDEAASTNETDIWSHRWSLASAKYFGYSHYGAYTTNDKNSKGDFVKINDYTIEAEQSYDGTQETIGVFAHEYGHALGLPDLYDTDYSSKGIGDWTIMASGSYNYVTKLGDRPAHPDAWCKYYLGWITPTEVTGTLTNEPIAQAATTADVYKLLGGDSLSGEYFLVENRQQTEFDAGLPGAGLLIWHIDGSTISNNSDMNEVNNYECYQPSDCSGNHYGVTLVQADGQWDLEKNTNWGDSGDPYPGSTGNTSFTENSSPYSNLYSGNNSNVSITEISNSDSTMTATFSASTPPPTPIPTTTPVPTITATPTVTLTVTPTATPLATPTPAPTPSPCIASSLEAKPAELEIPRKESATVTVTVTGENGCPVAGQEVKAKISSKDKEYIKIEQKEQTTDANGQAVFTITARKKVGAGKVQFKTGDLRVKVKVEVVK